MGDNASAAIEFGNPADATTILNSLSDVSSIDSVAIYVGGEKFAHYASKVKLMPEYRFALGDDTFIYKDKKWDRVSSDYYSNSGKTKDRSIAFHADDGTVIDHESSYKNNRKNSKK